jgi:hypothetical protein
MLKTILIITITVFNLGSVETAYQEHLQYDVVERGIVSEDLGAIWDAPAMAGHKYVLMQPASQAEVYIRFIENEPVDGYAPLTTHGWNSTELLVTDPDKLAQRLTNSPFKIIGPPMDLWDAPNAPRAMQTLGPGNEVLYLTRNIDFDTHTPVDRAFIMVLGGPSMTAMSDFYRQRLGLEVSPATPFAITVIAQAQGVAADTQYPLAVATISEDFLLELDQYPQAAGPRPVIPGHLPPGISMVSFEVEDIDALDVEWRATPRTIAAFPYDGRQVGVTQGAAGEWLELIEISAVD